MRELPGRLVLLGHPVAHSLSPAFQNAALRAASIPLTYEALDVAPHALASTIGELVAARAAGNVTVPHKEAVFGACARHSAVAMRVGAVNTFWVEDGTLMGDNTDVAGFEALARQAYGGAPPPGLRVAMLGAGGASAAALVAIGAWPDARVALAARTRERAERLAARFAGLVTVASGTEPALEDADLVINATPLGLSADDRHPAALDLLPPGAVVLDLVYRRGETPWVRAARACGHVALDGLPMLLEQGAAAFVRWFDREPDRRAMREAVR